jgi:hypothetical protein
MKRSEEIEKELAKLGVTFVEQKTRAEMELGPDSVTVGIELAAVSEAPVEAPDFSVRIQSARGVATIFSDWQVEELPENVKVLKLKASITVPCYRALHNLMPVKNLAMTFLDFCYYSGSEPVSPDFKPDDVTTPLRDGAVFVDLGWHLPARFADQFIDAAGKLDNIMLGGHMENAVIYLEKP